MSPSMRLIHRSQEKNVRLSEYTFQEEVMQTFTRKEKN